MTNFMNSLIFNNLHNNDYNVFQLHYIFASVCKEISFNTAEPQDHVSVSKAKDIYSEYCHHLRWRLKEIKLYNRLIGAIAGLGTLMRS